MAKKSLGQHFLTDQTILSQIADASVLDGTRTVVEIGAGLGDLTALLAARAKRVIAVEKDNTLALRLRDRFAGTNVQVLHADALELSPEGVLRTGGGDRPYVVAGNLPYNISQPLLRRYLECENKPDQLVVMLQAEVAESIVARPGKMSLLSLAVQVYGEPELLFYVPAAAFHPPPRVRSAVIRIVVEPELRVAVSDLAALFLLARASFGRRRKQIRNALSSGLQVEPAVAEGILSSAAIQPDVRAQELALHEWSALTESWIASGRPGLRE